MTGEGRAHAEDGVAVACEEVVEGGAVCGETQDREPDNDLCDDEELEERRNVGDVIAGLSCCHGVTNVLVSVVFVLEEYCHKTLVPASKRSLAALIQPAASPRGPI